MISTTSTTIPSVASIFTGVYPVIHDVRDLGAGSAYTKCVTLPQVLKGKGYHTYAEVTGPLIRETNLFTDFDHHVHRTEKTTIHTDWGENLINTFKREGFEEPWFVFLHLWELHRPRAIKRGFDKRKYGKNKYERALSSLDSYFGTLLDNVDSMVVVHGDHGERIEDTLVEKVYSTLKPVLTRQGHKPKEGKGPFWGVGHGYHVYDFLINPPFIVCNADVTPKKKVVTTPVSQIDILPTLLDLLGVPLLSKVQGISLVPLMMGGYIDERPLFIETCGSIKNAETWKVGVRTSTYKYIYSPFSKEGVDELYDLEHDPEEKKNIVEHHRNTAAKYRDLIEKEYLGTREKALITDEIKRLKDLGNL